MYSQLLQFLEAAPTLSTTTFSVPVGAYSYFPLERHLIQTSGMGIDTRRVSVPLSKGLIAEDHVLTGAPEPVTELVKEVGLYKALMIAYLETISLREKAPEPPQGIALLNFPMILKPLKEHVSPHTHLFV